MKMDGRVKVTKKGQVAHPLAKDVKKWEAEGWVQEPAPTTASKASDK